ncbi:hypothetical protein BB560_007150, partial [Smittium megazygosporum]
SPFYALMGYHPKFHFIQDANNIVPEAENRIAQLKDIRKTLESCLEKSIRQYKAYSDKKRTQGQFLV